MLGHAYVGERALATDTPNDEVAFWTWLRDPSSTVGFIVYVYYHGDSAIYPNYGKRFLTLSSFPMLGSRGRLASLPTFTRQISADSGGEVQSSFGQLVIDNAAGDIDLWYNLSVDGQLVRVLYGDPSWPVGRFRLFMECVADSVASASETTITMQLRAMDYQADQPIQTRMIADNVAAKAPSNTPVPIVYGQVFNVTPPCVDDPNQVYQIHDTTRHALTSVSQVRDSGVQFNTNAIPILTVDTATGTMTTSAAHGFSRDTRVRCPIGSMPSASSWQTICWNGRFFVAIDNNVGSSSATSPDGFIWTAGATSPVLAAVIAGTGSWKQIAWNGAVFVAVGGPSGNAATSTDGLTWTAAPLPTSGTWTGVAWNGSVFVAVGQSMNFASSPDGTTWTSRAAPLSQLWYAVCWNGTTFCAVGQGATAATSVDGITWIARTLPAALTWGPVGSGPNGMLLAVAGSSAASSTDNGATWTTRTLASNFAGSICWSGKYWVVLSNLSQGGSVSTDGINWVYVVLPSGQYWQAIAHNGSYFCAIGPGAASTISFDGTTWSGTSNSLPAPMLPNTDYFVIADGLTTTAFRVSAARGGSVMSLTTGTTGGILVGYHWTVDLPTGKLYLDGRPAGVLTLDCVAGSVLASAITPNALGISNNIDALSQTNFAATCPQTLGIFVAARRNRRDVANDAAKSVGGWFGYNRTNQLRFGRIEPSYSTYDVIIGKDQMLSPLVIERIVPTRKQHRLGYRKNWTDQTQGLAGGVGTEARSLYSTPYSVSPITLGADEGADGSEFHLLAEKPDVIETMMAYGSEAKAEANRRNTLFYGKGPIFACKVQKIGWTLDPGQVVRIVHPRFGLAAGVNMSLVYVEDLPDERAANLKFFAAVAAYLPGQL